jgi:hypothetical protein
MKPDYGAYLHARHTVPATLMVFYDVLIGHVSLTDVPGLTTLTNKVENGVEYAVSFDFSEDAAVQLIMKAPGLGAALQKVTTAKLDQPLLLHLEATLGPLQRSATETFAPLLVRRIL